MSRWWETEAEKAALRDAAEDDLSTFYKGEIAAYIGIGTVSIIVLIALANIIAIAVG